MVKSSLHSGAWSATLGLVGAGAIIIAPSQLWIGWVLFFGGIAVGVWALKVDGEHWWKTWRLGKTWLYLGLLILVVSGLIYGMVILSRSTSESDDQESRPDKLERAAQKQQVSLPSAAVQGKTRIIQRHTVRPDEDHAGYPRVFPLSIGISNDNTVVGLPVPRRMGDGNTLVGPTDRHENAIFNKGGTAIGAKACADSTSVAIGAGAGGGLCGTPPPINAPNNQGIITQGQTGGQNIINQAPKPTCFVTKERESTFLVQVESPYPAHEMRIMANNIVAYTTGDTESAMQVTNKSSFILFGMGAMRDDWGFATITSPYGTYFVKIKPAPDKKAEVICRIE